MPNDFFPSSHLEALAMLYLQNQNLQGKSPEELQAIYSKAYEALKKDNDSKRKIGYSINQKGIL